MSELLLSIGQVSVDQRLDIIGREKEGCQSFDGHVGHHQFILLYLWHAGNCTWNAIDLKFQPQCLGGNVNRCALDDIVRRVLKLEYVVEDLLFHLQRPGRSGNNWWGYLV